MNKQLRRQRLESVERLDRITVTLGHIRDWAKENRLHPSLIVNPKTHIIEALFKKENDAARYALVKDMATYSLDSFKLGFWLSSDTWPDAELNMWINFCVHHGIEWARWWDWETAINIALETYSATLIGLASTQDDREYFVSFEDEQALTMFKLLFT